MNQTETPAPADETLLRMRGELKELLGRTQGARDVLVHLAGVERALKALGMPAFDSLPTLVLRRAASQLESVLAQPVGPGIAELRARLAKALAAQEQAQAAAAQAAAAPAPAAPVTPRPALYSEGALQVSEATVTEFDRVVEASQRRPY